MRIQTVHANQWEMPTTDIHRTSNFKNRFPKLLYATNSSCRERKFRIDNKHQNLKLQQLKKSYHQNNTMSEPMQSTVTTHVANIHGWIGQAKEAPTQPRAQTFGAKWSPISKLSNIFVNKSPSLQTYEANRFHGQGCTQMFGTHESTGDGNIEADRD